MIFPQEYWQEAAPEQQGIDSAKLKEALAYLQGVTGINGIDETVVIRNGYMIWKGTDINRMHVIWSCTKSLVSTMLGLLIDDGKCSLETKAAEFVPELREQYPEVSLRHLTAMTSGYHSVVTGGGYGEVDPTDGSATPFTPTTPAFEPGRKYNYWDNAMRLFGYVLTRIAGEPAEALFRRKIAEPIGMNQLEWGYQIPMPHAFNGYDVIDSAAGARTTAENMARLGHLFLSKGNWDGRQLISREWVEQATSVQVSADIPLHAISSRQLDFDGRGVYGYNWWVNGVGPFAKRLWPDAPAKTFGAMGVDTNQCFVIPEWQMVIVRFGTDGGMKGERDAIWNELLRRISEAVVDLG